MAEMVRGSHAKLVRNGRRIASIAHPLDERVTHCKRCDDSGSVWIVCPDAGAVKVPCECRKRDTRHYGIGLADLGAAVVFAGGCAALFMLL